MNESAYPAISTTRAINMKTRVNLTAEQHRYKKRYLEFEFGNLKSDVNQRKIDAHLLKVEAE